MQQGLGYRSQRVSLSSWINVAIIVNGTRLQPERAVSPRRVVQQVVIRIHQAVEHEGSIRHI